MVRGINIPAKITNTVNADAITVSSADDPLMMPIKYLVIKADKNIELIIAMGGKIRLVMKDFNLGHIICSVFQ